MGEVRTLNAEELQKLYESWGGRGNFVETFRQFEADCVWASKHHWELQERYPSRWVAVYQGRVVGTAQKRNHLVLVRRLRRKGIPPEHTVVKFIYAKGEEPILILAAA